MNLKSANISVAMTKTSICICHSSKIRPVCWRWMTFKRMVVMVRDFVRKNKQAMGKRLNVRTFSISILFPHLHLYGQCLYYVKSHSFKKGCFAWMCTCTLWCDLHSIWKSSYAFINSRKSSFIRKVSTQQPLGTKLQIESRVHSPSFIL